jgi:hypothetical protein
MLIGGAVPIGVARSADRLQIPAFAADRRGNFVVAWQRHGARGGGGGILARRFDRHGSARGPQFDVNTITAGTQSDAAVAMERGGNFVVIWTGDRSDGQGPGVYGQRYRRDGSLRGGEFQVNSRRAGEGSAPGVNVHPTGGFVVTWPSGSSAAWLGRRYDDMGLPVGAEFAVDPSESRGSARLRTGAPPG